MVLIKPSKLLLCDVEHREHKYRFLPKVRC